jgi:beta-mannosidase
VPDPAHGRAPVDLSGPWRAHPAEPDLAARFPDPGLDDSGWAELPVPGHWRCAPGFESCDGPVLHRRRVLLPPLRPGERATLEVGGCFSDGDVWAGGTYVGATQGYFVPHAFDVSEHVRPDEPLVVAVEVGCSTVGAAAGGRSLLGVFGDPTALDPAWNPGGLWRPVRVRRTGRVRIARCRITCIEAGEERGRLLVDLTLDARGIGDDAAARVTAVVEGPDGAPIAEHLAALTLADGANHRRFEVRVDEPPLWWPWRLGDQPRCTVRLTVAHAGEVSDATARSTAFREVRVDDWRVRVNGEPLFVMGATALPTRQGLALAPPEEVARDVTLAVGARLDLLRLRAHVARPELYDAADEAGLLLWQDLPLSGPLARGMLRPALRQAVAMVDLLAHHPSVLLWCAHGDAAGATIRGAAGVAARVLPTWNTEVLDRALGRTLRRTDRSRPVVAHAGRLPGPASPGTDTALDLGWTAGRAADLASWLRRWPRLGRLVSGIGSASVPATSDFMDPGRWPALDWSGLAAHHGFEPEIFTQRVPPGDHTTFADWRDATQAYQAAVVQLQVEDVRRLRGRPAAGFLHRAFADAHPAVSPSLLDHERVPKPAYDALRRACRAVLAMVDPRSGAVHVVSEHPEPLVGARVTIVVDGRARAFSGTVAPREVTFVGRVDVTGARNVEARLEHPVLGTVTNRYETLLLALATR